MIPKDEAKAYFAARGEPLKVQLIEEKGGAVVSCYAIDDVFIDFCTGPHVPSTGRLKAFKLLTHLERLLEGRRAEPADAAGLRHGVLQRGRPEGAPAAPRGGEEARSPPARARARPVHVPPVGARRGVLAGQGHDRLQPARRLHAAGAVPGRLRRGEDAAHLQQGALGDVGALAALPPEHVPGRGRGRADGREGHELPGPHARVRAARAAATATCRCASTSRRRCTGTRRRACCPA